LHWKNIVSFCQLPYKYWERYSNDAKKLNIPIEDYLGRMLYLEE
jgi:hypothetical protein